MDDLLDQKRQFARREETAAAAATATLEFRRRPGAWRAAAEAAAGPGRQHGLQKAARRLQRQPRRTMAQAADALTLPDFCRPAASVQAMGTRSGRPRAWSRACTGCDRGVPGRVSSGAVPDSGANRTGIRPLKDLGIVAADAGSGGWSAAARRAAAAPGGSALQNGGGLETAAARAARPLCTRPRPHLQAARRSRRGPLSPSDSRTPLHTLVRPTGRRLVQASIE